MKLYYKILLAFIIIPLGAPFAAGCKGRGAQFPPPEKPLSAAAAAPSSVNAPYVLCGSSIFEDLSFAMLDHRKEKTQDALMIVEELLGVIESRTDAEWGGVFDFGDATGVSKRKSLTENAFAARALAAASGGTDASRAASAGAAIDYVVTFLSDPNGGFYAAQESDLMGPEGAMTGEEFYKLPDARRREIGMPAIDRTLYTAANAAAAAALLRASDFLGRSDARAAALSAIDRIMRDAWNSDSGASHLIPQRGDAPDASVSLLADNALVALALIEAYQSTGETQYLEKAESVAAFIDAKFGRDGATPPSLLIRGRSADADAQKIFDEHPAQEENLLFASALHDLYLLTDNEAYLARVDEIVSVLRAMSSTALFSGLGREVIFRMENHPLIAVIVGSKTDPGTAALRAAARKFSEHLKLVMTIDPELDAARLEELPYSPRPKPTLYACVDTACSFPADEPKNIEAHLRVFVDRHMFAQPQPGKLPF